MGSSAVEHPTFNRDVVGSIPTPLAKLEGRSRDQQQRSGYDAEREERQRPTSPSRLGRASDHVTFPAAADPRITIPAI